MIKEIIVCDECEKQLEKNEIKKYYFENYRFELCEECHNKKDGLKEDFETLCIEYRNKRKALLKKYSIDKLLNM